MEPPSAQSEAVVCVTMISLSYTVISRSNSCSMFRFISIADDLLAVAPEAPQLVGARGVTVGYEFADDFVVVVHGGACLVIGNGLVAPGDGIGAGARRDRLLCSAGEAVVGGDTFQAHPPEARGLRPKVFQQYAIAPSHSLLRGHATDRHAGVP